MRPGELRLHVLVELSETECYESHAQELANALGPDTREKIDTTLRRLLDEGLVVKTGRAVWSLTDEGLEHVAEVRRQVCR